jgi:hypothetical protein
VGDQTNPNRGFSTGAAEQRRVWLSPKTPEFLTADVADIRS